VSPQTLPRQSPVPPVSAPPISAAGFRPIDQAPRREAAQIVNAMSVDVEDYFQVQAFANTVKRDRWDEFERRVESNTDRVLQIFADQNTSATFFTLGWVAERYPQLIRRIADQGHEVASHGWAHHLVTSQTPEEFRADIRRTRGLLEDLSGQAVTGYRAATFSIGRTNLWAFDVLAEEGYRYSSSIFPVHHDLYGMPEAPHGPFRPRGEAPFVEFPMCTVEALGRTIPCSGGGYFRLMPYAAFSWAVRRLHAEASRPCIFYFHPWEIDPDQPRVPGLSMKGRFRHYLNLDRMEPRLRRLLADFRWDRMDRVFGSFLPN
jgi:polysaccharide deacetylase family protein (PEP-CTERM system associated)